MIPIWIILVGFCIDLNRARGGVMMKFGARDRGLFGTTAIFGATFLLFTVPVIANSQQQHDIIGHDQHSTRDEMIGEPVAASNFDDRWTAPVVQYTLGTDGTVRSDSTLGSNISQQQKYYQIGYILPDAKMPATRTAKATIYNQIDNNLLDVLASRNAPECGPSPLDVDQIKELVVAAARRHGVDEVLAKAIVWAESGFDRTRNSPKGARGPMQLIPQTATRFGVEDPCDPAQNIEGGVKYLRVLLNEFQNPLLAAAAYNSGEQRIYEYGGVPPFPETVSYVAKVLNYQIGLPMPSAKGKARPPVSGPEGSREENEAVGVIAIKKTGTFVGGVMHF